jgi:hypothetical protein
LRQLATIAAGSIALVGCGADRGMIEAGLGAAALRHAVVATEVCGRPTGPLSAPRIEDARAKAIAEADVPGGHGRVFQLGTGTATIAGYDDEGRRCERAIAFTYRAVKGSKSHPEPWKMVHLGPVVGAARALAASRKPTAPTRTKGDAAVHERTVSPEAPTFDVDLALAEARPVTIYLAPVEDAGLPADALSMRVLLGDRPVFEDARVGVTALRVLVAPVAGVYTVRVASTFDRPIPVRLEVKEGLPDAVGP